jgi:hypothetical protein
MVVDLTEANRPSLRLEVSSRSAHCLHRRNLVSMAQSVDPSYHPLGTRKGEGDERKKGRY